LGAATTTPELPLPPECAANPYLRDYLKMGKKNDPEQVKLLQTLLNEQMDAHLPVTGFFGSLTKKWVKAFQKTHHAEIIKPWIDAGYKGNIGDGTGYVYKTTKRAINMLKCAEAAIPMPDLNSDL
jgi:peptidoglycan hydrolase-like protein with peptidoglycan-binding domain